ncbi:MAG: ABC transporter permease [Selenomonadaceae bacterium]|nr:ABC transporter permease [Selenomonadaceae bacterium]
MPYEKVCIMVAMVVTLLLTVLLGQNFAKDAKVAVIDLDNTKYSQELITKLNASEYIQITAVLNTAVNPESLCYRDQAVAVVYLPRGLEKNIYAGDEAPLGVFYDNTNTAWTAEVKEALNEIVAIDNAKRMGGSASGLTLNARNIFNPAGSTSNSTTQGFLFFFGSMFFTFATIGMVPRLRLSHELDRILLEGSPWDLIFRIVPYGICLLTSFVVGMAVLRIWGDMVFSGHLITFLFVQVFFVMTVGMLSLLFGWTAANPGIASSRMILFIPGGFILGGVTSPLSHLADWVVTLSHVFPLTWEYHFVRDIITRGAGLLDITKELGAFFVYIGVVAILFSAKFYSSKRKLIADIRKQEVRQQKLQNLAEARTE